MDYRLMSMQVRREMLKRSMAMASSAFGAGHPEAKLLGLFRTVRDIEVSKVELLEKRPNDVLLDIHMARLGTTQAMHVEEMCAMRATTIKGLRARAQAYAFWDAQELPYRASVGGTTDDLMLEAFVRDLTDAEVCRTAPGTNTRSRKM